MDLIRKIVTIQMKSLKDDFDDSATPEESDDPKVKYLNGWKRGLEDSHVVLEVLTS